jgi:PAS domain S-box-containing protein
MIKEVMNDEQLMILFEKLPGGIIALDKNWHVSFINKNAEEVLKCPPGYLIGKNIWEEFPESIGNLFYKAYHEALSNQENKQVEDYSTVTGKWTRAVVYPSPSGLTIYFQDVTEQKRAESMAWASEDKYRMFLERITDGFIALDKNFRYTYVNQKIGEMVQRNPESLIGKNVWEEFPEAVGSTTYKAFQTAMKEQRFISNVDHYEPLNLWQENYIYPSPEGLSVFIKDISERKKLEKQLLEQERKQQLKITKAALEAQEKERTYIGQELHDNVNQMIVATKLMLTQISENVTTYASMLPRALDSLERVIQENRRLAHELVKPDLKKESLLQQLNSLVDRMLHAKGIQTQIDVAEFQEYLLDEPRKLAIYRIAQEQCTNIIKYAKARNVMISLMTVDSVFTVIIKDDGQGTEGRKAKKGIGLRNIEGRASIFHGKTQIKTQPGKGFRLSVSMPTAYRD